LIFVPNFGRKGGLEMRRKMAGSVCRILHADPLLLEEAAAQNCFLFQSKRGRSGNSLVHTVEGGVAGVELDGGQDGVGQDCASEGVAVVGQRQGGLSTAGGDQGSNNKGSHCV